LGLAFLAGSLLGALAAGKMTQSGSFDLYGAILRFTLAAKTGSLSADFLPVFARCLGLIAFTTVAGLTTWSVFLIPAVFTIKGFSFSYTVCSFCAVLGRTNGVLVSLAVCGLRNIFTIFGLVVLSAEYYGKTLDKKRRKAGLKVFYPDKDYMCRTLLAFASAGIALLCELTLTPALASAVSGLVP